jgi:carbon monoxide dehydrogenase subunit G
MRVSGRYVFSAPAEKVWSALLDPKILAGCMPGCESLEPLGDDQYQAVLTIGIGAIKGRYNARITMRDKVPQQSYRLVVEGTGASGFANGESLITLVEQEGKTTVQVESEAQVGGTVARVGQRMMGSAAQMMLGRFFSCLQQSVSG